MKNVRWFAVPLVVAGTTLSLASPALAQSDAKPKRGCETHAAPSFPQIFTGTLKDFKGLPTHANMQLLSFGAVAALGAFPADQHVSRTFSATEHLNDTFEAGRIIGGTPAHLAASFTAYGLGRSLNNPCLASLGADLVKAQLMAQILSGGMKFAVSRTRPDGTAYSFPSGHTTMSFATATVLQSHFGWKVGVPAYAVASYVAASRVQAKRHYLSDVLFGAALGIVSGRTVTLGTRHRFAITPVAPMDGAGAGVGLTWVGKK
jgi:membrane-associated phospholipid phosphatase